MEVIIVPALLSSRLLAIGQFKLSAVHHESLDMIVLSPGL